MKSSPKPLTTKDITFKLDEDFGKIPYTQGTKVLFLVDVLSAVEWLRPFICLCGDGRCINAPIEAKCKHCFHLDKAFQLEGKK